MPEEPGEWVLVGLDAKIANKRGVPVRIPVPTAELESIGDKGMSVEAIRGWISRFMATAPAMSAAAWRAENAALVKSFEAFVGKKDVWNKAQDAFGRRDFKTAIGSLRMISAIDPGDHAARLNLATALSSEGDHAGALTHLDAIAATWGDEAEFHVTRANVLLSLDRRDDAIGALADALEKDGSHRPALDALVRLGVLVAVYEDPRDAASLTYVRADSLKTHLEQVWDAAPRDAAYYLEQAGYHEMERRFEIVLAAADRAIALGGDTPHPRALSAKIGSLRALGRLDEATALARSRVEQEATAQALVELSRCQLAAGKTQEALAGLDRALAVDPGDLVAIDLRWWPAERHDLMQLQEGTAHMQAHAVAHPQAIALAPGDDDARAEWWGELLRRGGAEAVLADAAKIDDMGKRDWKLRWSEAEAYAAAKRPTEARAAFAAINQDEGLQLDVRKRAKRAAMGVGTTG